ncbi:MAG: hypothetical protein ACP5QK_07640 [Myxococcota bacterium]
MDKVALKKKIGFISLLLLIPQLNIRPYFKNFILKLDIDEYTIEKISKISRSNITFEIDDRWIEDSLISLLKTRANLNYSIIISGDMSNIRIKNIKRLNPQKIGYIVNEFVGENLIDSLNMLKPHNVYLIFKRLPEDFEVDYIKNGKMRELTIFLDSQSAIEFINRIDQFKEMRINIKPVQSEALLYLSKAISDREGVSIVIDSRILDAGDIPLQSTGERKRRFIYEISSNTYYNNFLKFIKSDITELNIYYNSDIPKRDNIIDWILKTDP